MNRNQKNKIKQDEQRSSACAEKKNESGDASKDFAESNWQRDIEKHDYYYDDSHGYKIFNPAEDDEEDEN